MKVLVTGYAGQLGYEVVRLLESRGVPCKGVDMADFNLTDAAAVLDYVQRFAPDVIVHCAAYTNVDKAETEPEVCAAVNGMGTLYMVRAALSVGAKLVYISTDYVFSGTGDQPFEIDDPYGPKNVYGVSKVQGEDAVRSLMTRYYIVRTGSVFGNSKDPVRSVLRAAQDRRSLTLSCDRIIQPTWSKDLARVICDLVMTDSFGIWHARNKGACTPAEFAEMVMKKTGVSCQIIPVHDAELPSHARRPLNSRLAAKLPDGITPMPDLGDALDRYLQEIIR